MSVSIPQIQLFVLALTRILAILSTIPILGGQIIPLEYRVIFGIIFTILLIPWQPLPADAQTMSLFTFTIAELQQLIIGIIAGFAITITFAAVQITGDMIGTSTGFTASRILNPAFEIAGSTLDQFFLMLALLFLLVTNSHHIILLGIQSTFKLIPLNTPLANIPADEVMKTFAGLINAGIQIALPAMGALLMADVTLGMLSKVAPQIPVFFLGIPLKIALGLLAVIITISMYYPAIIQLLKDMGPRMLNLLGA